MQVNKKKLSILDNNTDNSPLGKQTKGMGKYKYLGGIVNKDGNNEK